MAGWTRYGWYRYGRSEFRPDKDRGGIEYEDKGPTPEELFGTGVALKSADDDGISWDFVADSSGDLGATKGVDELGKDVAFKSATEGNSLIGTLSLPNDQARLENDLEQIMLYDSRVTRSEASVSPSATKPNRVNVGLDVWTNSEQLPEFVYPMEW